MLNKVWFWLVFIGIVYGFGKGAYQEVVDRTNPVPSVVPADNATPDSATDSKTKGSTEQSDAATTADERGLVATGKRINAAAIDSATVAVELCIGLIGIMAALVGLAPSG